MARRAARSDSGKRGAPRDAAGRPAAELFVIALGKLGGRELNYSSDIDLMFIHSGGGETSGDRPVTTAEFFKTAASRMTELLSTYSPEGLCYRVDLRLRPEGKLGEICQSLESARQYYATRGRDWELQMLIKARVAAGDAGPGTALLEFAEPLIYRTTTDFSLVEAVSETRARIHEKQAKAKAARIEKDRIRQARLSNVSLTSSSRKAASAISSFWCSASSVCTEAANRGCGTVERCWRFRGCATKSCFLRRNFHASQMPISFFGM